MEIELQQLHRAPTQQPSHTPTPSTTTASITPAAPEQGDAGADADTARSAKLRQRLRFWWTTTVCPTIPTDQGDPRDFLALERTLLAYVRTGNAIASFAIVAAQLFILHEDSVVGGKVFACLALALAIYVSCDGARRYFRLQGLLRRGRYRSWNWENGALAGLFAVIVAVVMVLVLVFG